MFIGLEGFWNLELILPEKRNNFSLDSIRFWGVGRLDGGIDISSNIFVNVSCKFSYFPFSFPILTVLAIWKYLIAGLDAAVLLLRT